MSCAETRQLLGRYAEGELASDRRRVVRSHLEQCPSCGETARLLEREEQALREILRGEATLRSRPRATGRLVAAATVVFLLIGGSLFVLFEAYERAGRRTLARSFASSLDRPVRIRARGLPLDAVLADLSDQAGLPIVFGSEERERPLVDLDLVEPVRLRSVLGLLEDFYGLRSRVESDRLVID